LFGGGVDLLFSSVDGLLTCWNLLTDSGANISDFFVQIFCCVVL
jgi:hypothetical protein